MKSIDKSEKNTNQCPPNETASDDTDFDQENHIKNNSEFCDLCNEGGNLLCCDYCPAAFHYICA